MPRPGVCLYADEEEKDETDAFRIPLAIALAGTVGSLAFGAKKAHVLFGAALTGLSLWHMYQHRKVMLRQMQMAKQPLRIGCKPLSR